MSRLRLNSPLATGLLSLSGVLVAVGIGFGVLGGAPEKKPQWEPTSEQEQVGPKLVVLFVVDTLRADRLSCYGYGRKTSPNLDALANVGTRFAANYSQSCWTVPSMISMMSGLFVFDEEVALPGNRPTMAELLQKNGVETAAFVGNRTIVHDRGFERGFDTFEGPVRNGKAKAMVERFCTWFEEEREVDSEERPLFVWLHSMDPHDPYNPAKRFQTFGDQELPGEDALLKRWSSAKEHLQADAPPEAWSLDQALENMLATHDSYDGEVQAADEALGQLVAFLRKHDVWEDTMLVFASDHGEKLYEHLHNPLERDRFWSSARAKTQNVAGLFGLGHRAWFQEQLWNTPLVMVGSQIPAGRVEQSMTENIDILPTILHAFDFAKSPWLAGQSLLVPEDHQPREFAHAYGYRTEAIRSKDWKLIKHTVKHLELTETDPDPDSLELLQLNHLGEDPEELQDRVAQDESEALRLRAEIEAWRQRNHRKVRTGKVSEQAEDALRQLGYIED